MPTPIVINTTAAWPGAIDTFVNVPVGGNQQLLDHEGMHNKDHNVLAALQADIGVTGATGPSTLRGRIKTLEAGGGGGGSAGATGATGPTGAAGAAGATGVAGVSGAAGKNAGLNYVFDSDITSTAPASGKIKFNAASPSQTLMRISHTDADANLITTLLQSLYASTAPTKCTLTIIKAGDPTTVLCLGITAGVAFGGREEYTVSYINANNTFANGDSVIVQFSVSGNNGAAGATGVAGSSVAGATGATGQQGATGAAGVTGASGGGSGGSNQFSMVSAALSADIGTIQAPGAGNLTLGVKFFLTSAKSCTGVNFYWIPTTSTTIRASIWDVSGGTELAHINVSTTGAGNYTGTFATAVALSAYKMYIVSIYDASGAYGYVGWAGAEAVYPYNTGLMVFMNFDMSGAGQSIPTTSNATGYFYPTDPVFT